jgi:hypothetical protein
VPGVQVAESLRLPTDLLQAVGTDDLSHPLYVVVTRNRTDPQNPGRPDPESSMVRVFTLPSARSFSLIGDVRLDSSATAAQLAAFVGGADGPVATESSWLPGDLTDRGRAAFDADPATWWTPRIGDTAGAWVQLDAPAGASPSALTVTFAADGRHSVPSQLSVQANGTTVATVPVPDEPDGAFGSTRTVTVPVPAGTTATAWRLTVDDVHARVTTPWLGGGDYALPVAIASVDGLGVAPAPLAATVDTGCRSDLVQVGGQAQPVRVTGSVADAMAGQPLQLVGCGDVALPAGDTILDTTTGQTTGLSVDRVALASLPGGGAVPAAASGSMDAVVAALQPAPPVSQPSVSVVNERPDQVELEVSGLDQKSWLVFGQSLSDGWSATSPELGDLGTPTMIQGFANGWTLDPTTGTVHITLEWTPQKVVWAGMGISLIGLLACLVILLVPVVLRRRRRPSGPRPTTDDQPLALDRADRPSGWTPALVAGGGTAVFAALNLPHDHVIESIALAIGLGVVTGAVVRRGRGQTLLGWIAPASLALAGIYVIAKEWRGGYRSSEWPQLFDPVHVLGVLAVLALAGVAVVNAWRDERGAPAQEDDVTGSGRSAGSSGPAPPA